jgi:hyperosmotically inducible periplasmic protein
MRQLRQKPLSKAAILLFSFLFILGPVTATFAAGGGNAAIPPTTSPSYEPWLVNQVRHELVMQPFYTVFDNLQYRVDGTTVTLMGQVVKPVLKSDAESAVKRIEGVETVVNKIEVLPPSPMDDRIRRAQYRAIYTTAGFQKYGSQPVPPIHIIVNFGHVTLEGSVANQTDKNLAGLRANQVSGVFSVTNNLHVDKS